MTHDEVNDLMTRMLTCAAAITATKDAGNPWDTDQMALDACSLLFEAASALEKFRPSQDLGPPMEIIKPTSSVRYRLEQAETQVFADPGVPAVRMQPVSKNACPGCDSRASKIVHRVDNRFELECPVCGTRWGITGKAEWR